MSDLKHFTVALRVEKVIYFDVQAFDESEAANVARLELTRDGTHVHPNWTEACAFSCVSVKEQP